jgi:hypothetical protein
MATLLPDLNLQPWTFDNHMMDSSHSSPSGSSSATFFENKIQITSNSISKFTKKPEVSTTLDQNYLSSEEELSPEELDTSADELDEDMENFRNAIKVAIAICLMPAPCKPRLVDIPCPSLTNSPSVQSTASGDSSYSGFGDRPPTPVRSSKRKVVGFPASISSRRESDATSPASSPRSPNYQTPIRQDYSTPSSPNTPITPNTPSKHKFLDEDPFVTPKKLPHQGHSRLRSLSGKFTHLVSRNSSTKSTNTPVTSSSPSPPKQTTLRKHSSVHKIETTRGISSTATTPTTITARHISAPVPPTSPSIQSPALGSPVFGRKLIPRGASEREPAFELPPFPEEDPQTPPKRRKSALHL